MSNSVGIDALGFALPRLVLPMQAFAEGRGMEYEKLRFGLGLEAMAVPDTDEDCVTLAAQAAWNLISQQGIKPHEIGRIYLGTESAVDAAKPSATYVHGLLEERFASDFGPRSLAHCDALDMTFACAGGVDALLNSADWVRAGRGRKALVIAADVAKYAPHSPGEYTQGAGAVALLVAEDPRILVLDDAVGVSVESASDFFKPRRSFDKGELAAAVGGTLETAADHPFWATPDSVIEQFLEFPVFDGPYSNDCYVARVREALGRYEAEAGLRAMNDWFGMCFHLPYAFQGRRMWPDIALDLYAEQGLLAQVESEAGVTEADVVVCCGGGGLTSGIALALVEDAPKMRVHPAEPAGFDDVTRSLAAGKILSNPSVSGSICDAIVTPQPGALTFPIMQAHCGAGVVVTDEDCLRAMGLAYERLKIVVEPGGAAALAAALFYPDQFEGDAIIAVTTGGNVDPATFIRALETL